jgi:hypothetical protein
MATLETAIYDHNLDLVKEILIFMPRLSRRELDEALTLATWEEEGGDVNSVMSLLFYGVASPRAPFQVLSPIMITLSFKYFSILVGISTP